MCLITHFILMSNLNIMTSVKSLLCVRFLSLSLFVLAVLNLVTRAMVRAFLHAKLMLLFSFSVSVNFYFYFFKLCVYLVYDFHNKYKYISRKRCEMQLRWQLLITNRKSYIIALLCLVSWLKYEISMWVFVYKSKECLLTENIYLVWFSLA